MNSQAFLIDAGPFSEAPETKKARMLANMNELVAFHAENCLEYRRILEAAYEGRRALETLEDVPVLPARIFKEMRLSSVPEAAIVKTLTSSRTSGQKPSQILLDKQTATAQAHALVRIVQSYLGKTRWPMLLIDHAKVLKDRNAFSARGAGILGFSQFGADQTYALQDETLQPDWPAIEAFLGRHRGQRKLLFGFTSIIWRHFLDAIEKSDPKYDFSDGVLIHGGGWKKLAAQNISSEDFKKRIRGLLGIRSVYNYYGMVEQTGSIYMECEEGFLHASEYSEVLVRNPRTLKVSPIGEAGLIETLSTLPQSYPGHALLTEDLGVIHGTDGCACARRGTYFSVLGRLANAELRGCSDTHQAAA